MKRSNLLIFLMVVIGLCVYSNSLSGPFIFDDISSIAGNPHIRQLWPLWDTMTTPRNTTVAGRPIASLTLAINYALNDLNVWGYHAFNLTIHLLTALLLFGIVRRTLASAIFRDHYSREAPGLAMTIALFWMVHPLNTEAVSYIVQRTELLMGFFFLLTLYCVIRGSVSSHHYIWYAGAIVSCALGMGSKENMVSAPLIILLYDRVFLSKSFQQSFSQRWILYLGLAVTCFILAVLVLTNPHSASAGFGFENLSPWDYAKTQFGVIVHYLRLSFWPCPLVVDYYDWPAATTFRSIAPPAVIVIVLLIGTLWAFTCRPWLGFLGAWFFLTLGPTSSFLPLVGQFAAERRMYLPLAAVIVLFVICCHVAVRYLLQRLGTSLRFQRWLEVMLFFVVLCALGYGTVSRNNDYKSEFSIWNDVVIKRPNNARAHNNLGTVLYGQGKIEEAIVHFSQAVHIQPDHVEAHTNLGAALYDRGKIDEAITHYLEALRYRPNFPDAHYNLGIALANKGQINEAIVHYSKVLRIKPNFAEAHNNIGIALLSERNLTEAKTHFLKALQIKPNFAEAHYGLGTVFTREGNIEEATRHFKTALESKPDFQKALIALNRLHYQRSQSTQTDQ